MKKSSLFRSTVAVVLTLGFALTISSAQTIWDGNGNANNSGNWSVGNNWDTNAVPSAAAVQLNDVTSGTRTVTFDLVDPVNPTITTLALTQSTAGAANRLVVDAGELILTGTGGTPLTFTQSAGTTRLDIINGGILRSNGAGNKTLTNPGTINIGSTTTVGSLIYSGGGNTKTFNNNGTMALYGASTLGASGSAAVAAHFTLNNTGTLDLHGDNSVNGVRLGVTGASSSWNTNAIQLTNSSTGTVNVSVLTGAETGLVQFGAFNTGNQRGAATATNNGTFNIDPDATFVVRARRQGTDSWVARFENNADAVLNVGEIDSTDVGGLLSIQMHGGGSTTALGMVFENAGTANLYGTSAIRVGTPIAGDGGQIRITNLAAGVINLHDTSTLGSTARTTIFQNAGTLTKHGAGTASVLSTAAGTADNSGTIHVQAGGLSFSSALDNSGNIRGNGTLTTAGITSTGGNFAAGNSIGTLTLNLASPSNVINFESATTFTFELGTPNGTPGLNNDLIAFTGLNLLGDGSAVLFDNNIVNFLNVGGLAPGLYTLFTFDQDDAFSGSLSIGTGLESYVGSGFIYNADSIQLNVIPEPSSLCLLAVGVVALGLQRRRRLARS